MCSVPTSTPALKSTSQPAYQNLAAGTASASSIVSAVELKRERLLLQNLKAGRGLEGEATFFSQLAITTPGMKKVQDLPFKILYAEGLP